VQEVDLDSDTVQLLGELRKYQKWKLRLCGLLADDRVSGEVFSKFYRSTPRRSSGSTT